MCRCRRWLFSAFGTPPAANTYAFACHDQGRFVLNDTCVFRRRGLQPPRARTGIRLFLLRTQPWNTCPHAWLYTRLCTRLYTSRYLGLRICPCTCLYTCLSACLHTGLDRCLYTCPYTCIHTMSVHMPIHGPMHKSIHLSGHMSTRRSTHMSIHMHMHMSMHMSIHMTTLLVLLETVTGHTDGVWHHGRLYSMCHTGHYHGPMGMGHDGSDCSRSSMFLFF